MHTREREPFTPHLARTLAVPPSQKDPEEFYPDGDGTSLTEFILEMMQLAEYSGPASEDYELSQAA